MLEYMFFARSLCDEFIRFLADRGVPHEVAEDEGNFNVSLPDDLDEALSDAIDQTYERLLQAHMEVLGDEEGMLEKDAAGVQITLGDGQICTVRIDPGLVSRLLREISMEELRDLVHAIAQQVENPDNRPLCHT